jgi:hypothetical protein
MAFDFVGKRMEVRDRSSQDFLGEEFQGHRKGGATAFPNEWEYQATIWLIVTLL